MGRFARIDMTGNALHYLDARCDWLLSSAAPETICCSPCFGRAAAHLYLIFITKMRHINHIKVDNDHM
jgi:hypothetical protein